jgi:hypothetical protein
MAQNHPLVFEVCAMLGKDLKEVCASILQGVHSYFHKVQAKSFFFLLHLKTKTKIDLTVSMCLSMP